MAHDNAKTLENGFAKGLRMIEDVLYNSLAEAADALLVRVATNRQFIGFTGNTQTSYACGVYVNGKLVHVSVQHNWNEPTRRMKVQKGKVVFLGNPYEGQPRAVEGKVDIVENHGLMLSLRQLEEYKAPSKGLALMMTTGTEYSIYIEQAMSLDVLTNTFKDAARIINKSWRKLD
jgi:hypothetical protein